MASYTPLRQIGTFFKLYYINSDKQLENEIVRIYTPLVHKIAWTYMKKSGDFEIEDMVSAGYEGLLIALRTNTTTNSKQFTRYASLKIQGAIGDYLRGKYDFTSTSSYNRVKKYKEALAKGMDEKKIQEELGLTDIQFRHTKIQSTFAPCSYEAFSEQHDLESPHNTPEEIIVHKTEVKWLYSKLDTLSDRERQILKYRYWEQYSMRKISELVGISEARISQIHKKTLQKLRKEENN